MKNQILFVVMAHGAQADLDLSLKRWKKAANGHGLLLAHGGRREDFDALDFPDKIWIGDPRLRTVRHPVEKQSYCGVWKAVAEWLEPRIFDEVYWAEFDEMPVVPDPGSHFRELMLKEGADVLGRRLKRIDGTNDAHWLYHEFDVRYREPFEKVSRRENKNIILSMLGTGSFWKRKAFLEVAAHPEIAPCYLEVFLPTMAHHLGFRVRDFGVQSRFIGYESKTNREIIAEIEAGAWTIHPVKGREQWERTEEVLGDG